MSCFLYLVLPNHCGDDHKRRCFSALLLMFVEFSSVVLCWFSGCVFVACGYAICSLPGFFLYSYAFHTTTHESYTLSIQGQATGIRYISTILDFTTVERWGCSFVSQQRQGKYLNLTQCIYHDIRYLFSIFTDHSSFL